MFKHIATLIAKYKTTINAMPKIICNIRIKYARYDSLSIRKYDNAAMATAKIPVKSLIKNGILFLL